MEEGESVLEAIYEEDDILEEAEDVEMADVEEGELVEPKSQIDHGKSNGGGDSVGGGSACVSVGNEASQSKNRRRRENKKRNRKKRGSLGPNVTDINRFVIDTCRRLKEKKSYMVYTAVSCLGVSALSDMVKEVDAIQACGGQMTADGRRCRTGGGILWNILKTREPMAYKEIMKKSKDFEKQLKQPNIRQAPQQNKEDSSQETTFSLTDKVASNGPDGSQLAPQNQHEQYNAEQKLRSVHDRLRVPVSYDDLLNNDPKNNSATA